jgi:aryl-alcohol dehydrogenase
MKVTAAIARDLGAPLSVEELGLADLRPDEVRVRMVASGICHTDATARKGAYPIALPAVFGHEGAGVVDEVGAAVKGVEAGDHVVLTPASCGVCKQCRSGEMAYCANYIEQNLSGRRDALSASGEPVATHFFGQSSFSSYANVVARSVVRVDPDVSLEMIGSLGCGLQIVDTTAAPAVLNQAARTLAVRGTLVAVGNTTFGTEAPLEIGESQVKGWTFKMDVQGSSVYPIFIPRLIELWKQGRFPFEKLVKTYPFAAINKGFEDSPNGTTIKPIVLF